MNRAVLLIGGNLGDRFENLEKAAALIERRIGKIKKVSSIYETEPWGFDSERFFLNRVLIVETRHSAEKLLECLQSIEKELGRIRSGRQWSSRTMDIDILYFNEEIIETEKLTVPHKELANRMFVLKPLSEADPFYMHPVLGKTNKELMDMCYDSSNVKLIDSGGVII